MADLIITNNSPDTITITTTGNTIINNYPNFDVTCFICSNTTGYIGNHANNQVSGFGSFYPVCYNCITNLKDIILREKQIKLI